MRTWLQTCCPKPSTALTARQVTLLWSTSVPLPVYTFASPALPPLTLPPMSIVVLTARQVTGVSVWLSPCPPDSLHLSPHQTLAQAAMGIMFLVARQATTASAGSLASAPPWSPACHLLSALHPSMHAVEPVLLQDNGRPAPAPHLLLHVEHNPGSQGLL